MGLPGCDSMGFRGGVTARGWAGCDSTGLGTGGTAQDSGQVRQHRAGQGETAQATPHSGSATPAGWCGTAWAALGLTPV